MASGYQVNGTDLDSIFAPYHSGWPQAGVTHMQVAGADLNTRYAPLSTGTAAGATNYRVGGTDLNAIFAAAGSTGVIVSTQPANVSGSAAAGNPSGTVTSSTASCAGANGSGSYTYAWHTTNCTANSPNSASTDFYATVNAASTDNASAYCTISDGVTSVDTNTIAVALTNTTPAFKYNGTMVAGYSTYSTTGGGSLQVQSWGYTLAAGTGAPAIGSIAPTTDVSGNEVFSAYSTQTGSGGSATKAYVLDIKSAAQLGQSYFASATIGGTTLQSSSASYTWNASDGLNEWVWSAGIITEFVSGDSYPVQYE